MTQLNDDIVCALGGGQFKVWPSSLTWPIESLAPLQPGDKVGGCVHLILYEWKGKK